MKTRLQKVLSGLESRGIDFTSALPSGRYVARISGKGQFDITWQFWRLRDEQAE